MTRGRLALCSLVTGVTLVAAASAMTRLVAGWWLLTAALSVLILTDAILLIIGVLPRGKRRAARTGEPLRDPITGGVGVLAFTLVGYGTAIWWVLARFGGENLAFDPTPNRETLDRIGSLIAEVGPMINDEVAPIESSPPIALLLVAGVLLAALAANLFLVAGKPALAALPLIALWLPALAFAQSIPLPAFFGTVAGLLALLALTSRVAANERPGIQRAALPRASGQRRAHLGLRAKQVGTAVTAGALVVTLAGAGRVVGATETGATRWFEPTAIGIGDGFLTGEYVDLSKDLPPQSQREVFRYATADGQPAGPFAIRTLTEFDGRSWTAPSNSDADRLTAERLMTGTAPEGSVAINVGLVDRETPVLPVPAEVWSTRAIGPWYYNLADKSLVNYGRVETVGFVVDRDRWTAESLREVEGAHTETLDAWFPQLDPVEVLRNAAHAAEMRSRRDNAAAPTQLTLANGTTVAFDCNDNPFAECGWEMRVLDDSSGEFSLTEISADPALLAVPTSDYVSEIARVTSEVVGDAPTAFDQALAIQNWLRDPANFTYQLAAPPTATGDITWDFLTARTGYCVHFATAMAIMARQLGIPARVVTGFLSGDQVDGQFIVTADRAHMWPELQLPGAGWVRFEPTPASISGPPPAHANSSVEVTTPILDDNFPVPGSGYQPSLPLPESAVNVTASRASHVAISPLRAGIAGAATLVTVAAAYLTVAVARRRRIIDPDGAWQEVMRLLKRRGIEFSPAATPRQVVAFVDAEWTEKHQQPFPDSARKGLSDLANAVEQHRYLPADVAAADFRHLRASLNPIRDARPPRKFKIARRIGDRLPAHAG